MRDPLLKEYRQWSPKQYLDLAQRTKNEYNRIGALQAANTSDQGTGMAYMLTAKKAGDAAALPFYEKYGEGVTTSVDKAIDTANENAKSRHDVHLENEIARIAKWNQDRMAEMQWLHNLGTKQEQFKTDIQRGVGERLLRQYEIDQNNFAQNDPEILNAERKLNDAQARYDAATTDEERQKLYTELQNATTDYNRIAQKRIGFWQQTHIKPSVTPFTLPLYSQGVYTRNFSYLASGGKMEAAEKEKTRRQDRKLFYET